MTNKMTTYHSRETVKARKVTDKDGETVVTFGGFMQANKGDYVVDTSVYEEINGENVLVSGGLHVVQGAEFEKRYRGTSPGRGNGESTRTRKAAAKRPASKSATDRVKASQTASKTTPAPRK